LTILHALDAVRSFLLDAIPYVFCTAFGFTWGLTIGLHLGDRR